MKPASKNEAKNTIMKKCCTTPKNTTKNVPFFKNQAIGFRLLVCECGCGCWTTKYNH
jgi:hypothetical protein